MTAITAQNSLFDAAQERALLGEDETLFLGELEVGHALRVLAQARAVGLVRREAVERDEREGDVVGALVRHPVTDEIAAALRNDGHPVLGILLELVALEGFELVADEHRHGHGLLLWCAHRAS